VVSRAVLDPMAEKKNCSSSSSCSGRIRFDSCSLYSQNEIGPSISSLVVLCVFVLLVYIVVEEKLISVIISQHVFLGREDPRLDGKNTEL